MIAALFVATSGCYFGLPDVDPWDEARDARLYAGPHAVVAHPPCQLWVNLAAVNWKRYQRERPAWYPDERGQRFAIASDGGCFASALASVRKWGGVLEHPAGSFAFAHHDIPPPTALGWQPTMRPREWVCEVWQRAYGHKARKRTWLFYVGDPPSTSTSTSTSARAGEAQIGWFDRNKPTLSKREAIATPLAFRDLLLDLARSCHSRAVNSQAQEQ